MSKIAERLAEPSSSAGLAGAISIGAAWSAGQMPWEAAVPALLLSILAVFFPEATNRKPK